MSALTCKHKDHPEGVEWPELDALEHFTDCLLPGERAQAWHWMGEVQARGRECWMADHQGTIQHSHKLLAGISEAVERLDGAEYGEVLDIRDNLKALIS